MAELAAPCSPFHATPAHSKQLQPTATMAYNNEWPFPNRIEQSRIYIMTLNENAMKNLSENCHEMEKQRQNPYKRNDMNGKKITI